MAPRRPMTLTAMAVRHSTRLRAGRADAPRGCQWLGIVCGVMGRTEIVRDSRPWGVGRTGPGSRLGPGDVLPYVHPPPPSSGGHRKCCHVAQQPCQSQRQGRRPSHVPAVSCRVAARPTSHPLAVTATAAATAGGLVLLLGVRPALAVGALGRVVPAVLLSACPIRTLRGDPLPRGRAAGLRRSPFPFCG